MSGSTYLESWAPSLQGKLVAIMDQDSAFFFGPCSVNMMPTPACSAVSTKGFVVVVRIGWCGVAHKFLYRSRIVVLIDKQNL